jgi:PAS domain S-box-containing protein
MLAAIVESSDAAIIGKTLDGIVMSWNLAAERMFGFTAAEMIGAPINAIEPPSRAGEMRRILARLRRGERVEHLETERRRKDGRILPVLLTVSPIRDARGRIIGASKVAHDLSELRKAEEALQAKSAQLEELTHALQLAPAMVRRLDGTILFWGSALENIYGWSAAEAVGQNVHRLLKTAFPAPLPEIEAELLAAGEWQGELVQSHRDGARITVGSQWALHRDKAGTPLSVLVFNRDVGAVNRAQLMIEEREARLRSILETAPDAIITIDEKGIVQSFSSAAERLFGYTAGEVIGHNVKMLMPAPYREQHDGYLERYLRTGEKRIIGIGREVMATRKDGTVFPMELAVGEVNLDGSRIFTGFIRDLTARTKLEQELRQSQKMEAVGQLTGGIAHDFNNLLTVITGNLEMLENRIADGEQREIVAEAREAAELGAKLSSRLLAFGRRQPLHPRPVDLSALVASMVELLRRSLGERVRIETVLSPDLPTAMADPGQVENALLNLAINARDAMPQGGRLVVTTTFVELDADYAARAAGAAIGPHVMLSVADSGTGMSAEVRQRAFEPFFTTKGPGAGTGLGLSMVYGFVKQSGGHVEIDSELGRGTTIRMYLSAHGTVERAARRSDAAAGEEARPDATILLVEDDRRVRNTSVRRVKELGYRVIEAESGAAALAVLERGETVDLLFTDVVMPGMTGIELAREARRRRPGLRILFTSGYTDPVLGEEERPIENADWLAKPYLSRELAAKLRALLER